MSSDLIKRSIKRSVPGKVAQGYVPAVAAKPARTVNEVLYLEPQPDLLKWQKQSMGRELVYQFESQSTDPLTGRTTKEAQRIVRFTYTGDPFPVSSFSTTYMFGGVTTTPPLQELNAMAAQANNPYWQLVNMPDFIAFFRRRVQVAVHYPAIAARQAVPASPATATKVLADDRAGWNAGGRSITGLSPSRSLAYEDSTCFTFRIDPRHSAGIAVGLVKRDQGTTVADYEAGVLFASGQWSQIIRGVAVGASFGTYQATDVFTVKPLASGAQGWMVLSINGNEVLRFAITHANGPLYLDAAIFKGGDAVLDARFYSGGTQAIEEGRTFGHMPPAIGFGGVSGHGMGRARMPAVQSVGGIHSGQDRGRLPAVKGWSGSGVIGRGDLAAVTGEAGGTYGSWPHIDYGTQANGFMQGMRSSGRLILGNNARQPAGILPRMQNDANGGLEGGRRAARQRIGLMASVRGIGQEGDPTFARIDSASKGVSAMRGTALFVAAITSSGRVLGLIETRSVENSSLSSSAIARSDIGQDLRLTLYLDAIAQAKSLLGNQADFDAEDVHVWVMNDRNGAMSRYTNYGFNSFARIGDRYFGADSSGLYLLEGDCDQTDLDEVPIVGKAGTGLLDLGSKELKHVSNVYLSVASEGRIAVDVEVSAGYKTVERFRYYARSLGRNAEQQRVDVGRGLRSNFYAFEASNPDGGMFELDGFDVALQKSTRRI